MKTISIGSQKMISIKTSSYLIQHFFPSPFSALLPQLSSVPSHVQTPSVSLSSFCLYPFQNLFSCSRQFAVSLWPVKYIIISTILWQWSGPHLLHLRPHLLHLELVGGDWGGSAEDHAVAPLHRARAPGLGGAGGPHVAGPRLASLWAMSMWPHCFSLPSLWMLFW